MAERTSIEWADATFNPWVGCTKVSPGCDHCYAEASMGTRLKRVTWGAGQERQRTSVHNWRQPVRWNATPFYECAECTQPDCAWRGECDGQTCGACGGHVVPARRRVFCASLADVFDNEVPDRWREELFTLIELTPNLDWLLLTKRIGNAARMMPWSACSPPDDNVWLGATIVNQEEADRDIPKLLATPAAVRFVSMEPLLGPVDLPGLVYYGTQQSGGIVPLRSKGYPQLDWVIAGGESGHGARPSHPDWFRSLRDQCAAAGVPFMFKQWGEYRPAATVTEATLRPIITTNREVAATTPEARAFRPASGCYHMAHQVAGMLDASGEYAQFDCAMFKAGKKAAGRLLDGREHNGFPQGAA